MARRLRGPYRHTRSLPNLVIMAKTPIMGRIKQRLARSIGQTGALRFYRTCLSHAVLRLARSPRWRTYIAITPDIDRAAPFWRGFARRSGASLMPQGSGDLGQRMQFIFDRLGPCSTIVVGSDIPLMRSAHIAGAFKSLESADAILGPAEDGGYWLIGMRGPRRHAPFTGVRWSSSHALQDTIVNLGESLVVFAPILSDVDTIESFAAQGLGAERLIHQARP